MNNKILLFKISSFIIAVKSLNGQIYYSSLELYILNWKNMRQQSNISKNLKMKKGQTILFIPYQNIWNKFFLNLIQLNKKVSIYFANYNLFFKIEYTVNNSFSTILASVISWWSNINKHTISFKIIPIFWCSSRKLLIQIKSLFQKISLSQGRKIIKALKRNLFHLMNNRPNSQRKVSQAEKEKQI